MPLLSGISIELDKMAEFQAALDKLVSTDVMVGIPSDEEQPHLGAGQLGTEQRKPEPGQPTPKINNAVLGYIHEVGSPARNIPARAWLAPGVESVRSKTIDYLQQAGKAAFEGKLDLVDKILNAIGLLNQTAVKTRISQGIPPPLAPRTIAGRLRRSKLSPAKKARLTSSDFTPLIDTAQFINSISYVLRKRRR